MSDLIVTGGKVGIRETEKLSTLTVKAKSQLNLAGTVAKSAASTTLTGRVLRPKAS